MAKIVSDVHINTGPMTRRRYIEGQNKEYHYHTCRNDPDRVRDLCELYGYEVVRTDDKTAIGDPSSLEGAKTLGGDVLLRCPVEKWNERNKSRAEATRAQLEGPRETFKTEGQKLGVKVEDNSSISRGPMSNVVGKK